MLTDVKEIMTPELALQRLRELRTQEPESGHSEADDVLCELLRFLGHGDVSDAFDDLTKWYA